MSPDGRLRWRTRVFKELIGTVYAKSYLEKGMNVLAVPWPGSSPGRLWLQSFSASITRQFKLIGIMAGVSVAFGGSSFFTRRQTTIADSLKPLVRELGAHDGPINIGQALDERQDTFTYGAQDFFGLLSERLPELHNVYMTEG
jgi:hypothetical protein